MAIPEKTLYVWSMVGESGFIVVPVETSLGMAVTALVEPTLDKAMQWQDRVEQIGKAHKKLVELRVYSFEGVVGRG